MPRDALIVGLGLIGGSIALRLAERGWRVRYVDPFVNVDRFVKIESIDDGSLLIMATPVDIALPYLGMQRTGPVTSVCSVMGPLRDVARGRFVAGHPLAGSEESGFGAARADLFEGKPWFVDAQDDEVDQLVHDCGAKLERVEAKEHDEAVALTSHLPQVLSTALASLIDEEMLRFAGSGLKTFLRLAGSDSSIWKPVIEANRGNIEARGAELQRVVEDLLNGDVAAFEKAQRIWRRL